MIDRYLLGYNTMIRETLYSIFRYHELRIVITFMYFFHFYFYKTFRRKITERTNNLYDL